MQIDTSRDRASVTAILGPTNTGKTHLAMERMLARESGMIGFPLRLLARENYERAVALKGEGLVALITGEEKIIPAGARYFLCTVESMPIDRQVAFVGIDEIQMCADPDRGHVFTERLLNARGTEETMFMGADTIRPVLQKLVDDIEFESRPRLSTLKYTGAKRITRLKPRSAIVAFSAGDVYAIAEMIRRQSGGAAIVMGALSPRTRNKQVELFQNGDVDYLVATDAIGMGLNMDVDHVALAATRKFDGRTMRELTPPELAQIAGRAGRHMNDGTFGVTTDIPPLSAEVVEHIENHTFAPLKKINWRNNELNLSTLDTLTASLNQRPPADVLMRARSADDENVLRELAKEDGIKDMAANPDAVSLLWNVCRIPDFRNIMSDAHTRLLGDLYRQLMGSDGRLTNDWIGGRVERLNRMDGDIETLMGRIAGIRTWTYVSNQSNWVEDATAWQDKTRETEDALSDALHERLTQRFIDRRTALLMKRKDGEALEADVGDDGRVEVDGHGIGHLEGFCFKADATEDARAGKALTAAAEAALKTRVEQRIEALVHDSDATIKLTPSGQLTWNDEPVGRLSKGAEVLHPVVNLSEATLLDTAQKERVSQRLQAWIEEEVRSRLAPLFNARERGLEGAARGVVFQLGEGLGSLNRRDAKDQVNALTVDDRRALRSLGVRIGKMLVYMPALVKPAQVEMRLVLWAVANGIDDIPAAPNAGLTSTAFEQTKPQGYYAAIGFRPAGSLAVRADMLERLSELAWTTFKEKNGAFTAGPEFLSLAGCSVDAMDGILDSLGFAKNEEGLFALRKRDKKTKPTQAKAAPTKRRKPDAHKSDDKPRGKGKPHGKGQGKGAKHAPRKAKEASYDPDSPFAKLKALKLK